MKSFSYSCLARIPQLDITAPEGDVMIEYDETRGVLYVHVEGVTVLRICRIKGKVKKETTR